ncbi:MAG: hypothetical protein QXD10_07415 [Metallosphaera sp.]
MNQVIGSYCNPPVATGKYPGEVISSAQGDLSHQLKFFSLSET